MAAESSQKASYTRTILRYDGPFDAKQRAEIGEKLRTIINYDRKAGIKLFKIYFELALNIYNYSHERELTKRNTDVGAGTIVISEDELFYYISGSNKVSINKIQKLSGLIDRINAHDHQGLRDFKRGMADIPRNKFGGANIGLVQIGLLAGSPIKYNIDSQDATCPIFSLNVKIPKNSQSIIDIASPN